jgi:hypothetical protein
MFNPWLSFGLRAWQIGHRKRVLANKRRPLDGMLRKLGRLIVQSAPIRKATSVLTCTRGFDRLVEAMLR